LTAFLQAAEFHQANLSQDLDDSAQGQTSPALRTDPIMEHMVSGLNSTQILKISAAVAALPCRSDTAVIKSPPPSPPSVAKSCAACHGHDGVGNQFDVPILAGQQRAYLRRQLLLLRESAWGAPGREGDQVRSHPIMESETARLKIEDVDTLAQYYADLDCRGRSQNQP
jgi:cytochrome c553